MRRLVLMIAIVSGAVGLPIAAGAQDGRGGRSRNEPTVPTAYQPPPGMCRIWLDGVPPAQQPASTDCATAVRNRPSNGRVLFGDDAAGRGRKGGRGGSTERGARGDERSSSFRGPSDAATPDSAVEVERPMPLMSAATQYARGDRSGDAARWLGGQAATMRVSDTGRDGVPTRVLWLNGVGDVVQIWIDRDRDGRADRIETYRDGRRVASVGQ